MICENIECNDDKCIDVFETPNMKVHSDEFHEREGLNNTSIPVNNELKQAEPSTLENTENIVQNEPLVDSVDSNREQGINADSIEMDDKKKIERESSVDNSIPSRRKTENLFENENKTEKKIVDDSLERHSNSPNKIDNIATEGLNRKSEDDEDRDDSDSDAEHERDPMNIFKNTLNEEELSCEHDQKEKAEDNENQEESDSDAEDEEIVNQEIENTSPVKRKERRSKTISKQLMKETKSEQQRLMREKSVHIPYHTPTCKPLKEFLQRVPQLEKKSKSISADESSKRFSLDGIFKNRPSLSQPEVVEIDFDEDDCEDEKTENSGLTLFMKRFKRHNDGTKSQDKNQSHLINGSKTCPPKLSGMSRISFKEELKRNIVKQRQEYHFDLEKQLKFFDEDNYGDEDEEELDEEEEDRSLSDENNKDEVENEEKEDKQEKEEATNRRLNSHDSDADETNYEEDATYPDDSCSSMSSILHPGQGEPSNRKRGDDEVQLTPFTKLLKSGLLDSKDRNEETTSLLLPNENTQDLYHESNINKGFQEEEEEEEEEECQSFSLRLDEDAQFVGLDENTNTKNNSVKSLFDDDMKLDNAMSMTQVLGFCSGQFNEDKHTETPTDKSKNMNDYEDEFDDHDTQMGSEKNEDYDGDVDDGDGDDANDGDVNDDDNEDVNDEDGEDINDGDVDDEDDGDEDDVKEDDGDNGEGDENHGWSEATKTVNGDEFSDTEESRERPVWKKDLFYEDEAELSGSDVGSDDEDLGSEYDEYEVDLKVDRKYKSTDKLKKQVHKIHQRKMMDQDKKEIRLLQELYLEDGDLGGGLRRKRNFHWRNIDRDDDCIHNANSISDEEEIPDDVDIQKKLERLDRDNFIQEVHDSAPLTLDECSQSVLDKISSEKNIEGSQRYCSYKLPQARKPKRSGSFLGVSKPAVKVLVNTTNTNNSKNTKNFVFQTQEKTKENSGVRRKVSCEVDTSFNDNIEPPRKVTKLDKSKSIFYLM